MNTLVSLIICTYSRPTTLAQTLQSIAAQQLDGSFDLEVIIVDNSPNGQMKTALDPFEQSFKGRLSYWQETTQGKSRALNLGVQKAKGDVIAFTDDDVIADPAWLSTLVRYLRHTHADGVGGRVLPIYPHNTPTWVQAHPEKIAGGVVIYDYGPESFRYEARYYPFIGCNYAFKREVFDSCGLFRTDIGPGTSAMGEDTEFVERVVERGKMLYYCGDAVIRHPVDLERLKLRHIANWHIALGRFAARREVEKNEPIKSYLLGVPRYLWKGIVTDGFNALGGVFNRIQFLDAWRAFFRKYGMISEYRLISKRKHG
jgi:glycosyltransferase involved in cell wall biosynthesis